MFKSNFPVDKRSCSYHERIQTACIRRLGHGKSVALKGYGDTRLSPGRSGARIIGERLGRIRGRRQICQARVS